MAKAWLVARAEYLDQVRRRSFLIATLAVPLLIVGIMVVSILISINEEADLRPLGIVDQAGVLATGALLAAGEDEAAMARFEDEEEARQALVDGVLQGYYVLPAGYRQGESSRLVYWDKPPSDAAQSQFNRLLRRSLVAGQPEAVQQRLLGGLALTVRSADGQRESSEEDFIAFLAPFVVGLLFVFIVMGTAGYMLRAVTTEKESRTVEVIFTSLSPGQLVGGKAVGLMAVALTQIGLWLVALLAAALVASRYTDWLRSVQAPWAMLGVIALYFLPTYALVTGLMTTLGSMAPDQQQGQQIAGLVNMLFILPFFFLILVFTNPDSPLMVALTLFPTTAFITIAMRWGATSIPFWQLALSWVLLVATAGLSIWVASRVFRIGMLRYGQAIHLGGLVAILRQGAGQEA